MTAFLDKHLVYTMSSLLWSSIVLRLGYFCHILYLSLTQENNNFHGILKCMTNKNVLYYAGCYLPHARLDLKKKIMVFVELSTFYAKKQSKKFCVFLLVVLFGLGCLVWFVGAFLFIFFKDYVQ